MKRFRWTALALALALAITAPPIHAEFDAPLDCALAWAGAHVDRANMLSLSPGPGGLLLEFAPGDWGTALGASRTVLLDCDLGTAAEVDIPGVAEVSDPWFDASSGQLWFVSRSENPQGLEGRDIHVSRQTATGWQRAQKLPMPFNSGADEYSPVVRGSRLYFASARSGSGDLYVAELEQEYPVAEALPGSVNSEFGEWNLWVSMDEDVVVFESSGRPENLSPSGDLYYSHKSEHGEWRSVRPLQDLNTRGSDLNPRRIGDWLLFASSDPETRRTHLRSVAWSHHIRPKSIDSKSKSRSPESTLMNSRTQEPRRNRAPLMSHRTPSPAL